uniref:F-box domain-containing protein n=1 Tax=Tanacetum cinerariifolium TaxID=118510 RepID=A0A699GYC2_TANCI|nr:hypothetical protein [Tanacetum cinerariifolium]
MAHHIPFDIQISILKILPAKSLIRFRCVSNQWKSLIDSSYFVKKYQTMNDRYLLARNDGKEYITDKDEHLTIIDNNNFREHMNMSPITVPLSIPGVQPFIKFLGCVDDGVTQSFTTIFSVESNHPEYYNVEFRKNCEAIIETQYANNDDVDSILQVYDPCSGCVTDIGLPWSGCNDFEYGNVSWLSMSSYMVTLVLLNHDGNTTKYRDWCKLLNSACNLVFTMYKARLVSNGRNQQYEIDCSNNFSPVVKPTTIRTVLSLALTWNWLVHQLDVKNAFLNGYALRVGFTSIRCDSYLFIYQHGIEVTYLLIYVDDIIITASSPALLQCIISSLQNEFNMIDLGALNYFLRIFVTRDARGMFLSRKKYAMELLERIHMSNCNATRTLVDTKYKLGSDGDPICLHMHDPREPYLASLKWVLRYVRDTLDFKLQLYASPTSSLVAYTNVDWAGCPTTRGSTLGYCVFFGDNLFSWSSKWQHKLSHSSAKAEYRGVANVHVLHVPSRYQYADIFTKGLSSVLFEEFYTSLSVQSSPAQIAREFLHLASLMQLVMVVLVAALAPEFVLGFALLESGLSQLDLQSALLGR